MKEHEVYNLLRDNFSKTAFKNEEDKTETNAIGKAYADMSRHANGHSPEIKEFCTAWLLNKIFTSDLSISDFDTWHEKTCDGLVKKFNEKKKDFGTIGRAQKVINMAFKYLSCINKDYDKYIQDCHMTLDSYTLAWYKTSVAPWVKKEKLKDVEKLVEWSKIKSYDDYKLIQTNVRKYLKQSPDYTMKIGEKPTNPIELPAYPFQAEFIVWEGEILKEKYNNMIKELSKYREAGKTKDQWLIDNLFEDFLKNYCKTL